MTQSTAASQEQSISSTSLLARRPLVSYFVLAYVLAWVLWLPLVLSKGGGIGLIPFTTSADVTSLLPSLIIIVGSLAPALAAILMSASVGGWAAVKQLLRRMVQVRAGMQWYGVALFVPLVASFVPALVFVGSAEFLRVFSLQGVVSLLGYVIATLIGMVLGSPIGEEPGWRGFALPRLQQRYGALLASLILGPLWALWHLPLFFTGWGAVYQSIGVPLGILLFVLFVISGTIFMTWLFNNTHGSLFLAILAHSALDSTVVFFLPLFSQIAQAIADPAAAGATANLSVQLTTTMTWVVIAALVIGLTRGRLSYKRPIAHEAQISPEQPQ
jgi:uncharacterized protein